MSGEPNHPPLIKKLFESLIEPFDTIKNLQDLGVFGENSSSPNFFKPCLPSIVVMGEDFAGISVISTLIGVKLPAGIGYTIFLTLKTDSNLCSRKMLLNLKFEDQNQIGEKEVCDTTDFEKEISSLVLLVHEDKRSTIEVMLTVMEPQKCDFSLAIVILPEIQTGITDMDFVEGYIKKLMKTNGCVFLNVLPCTADYESYLSWKVVKGLDHYGKRSITVFTKLELSSVPFISKLTKEDMKTTVPYGFLFIKNDDKSVQEENILSSVHTDFVGYDSISRSLITGLLSYLLNLKSEICKRIREDLEKSLMKLPSFNSISNPLPDITSIVNASSLSLQKLFVTQEFDEYEDEPQMHSVTEFETRFGSFKVNLLSLKVNPNRPFLSDEISFLSARRSENCSQANIIKPLLKAQFAYAYKTIKEFVSNITCYIEDVVIRVLLDHARDYQPLHQHLELIAIMFVQDLEKSFLKKLDELQNLEKSCIYACNHQFSKNLDAMKKVKLVLEKDQKYASIEGLGKEIEVGHLKLYPASQVDMAFDMKNKLLVYWQVVVNRFVDYSALNLQSLINEMMSSGIKMVMEKHLTDCGKDKSKLPDEEPIVILNRHHLKNRIEYLQRSLKIFTSFK